MKRRVWITGFMALTALIAMVSMAVSGFNPVGGGSLKTGTLTNGKICTWSTTAGLVCTSDVVAATPIDDNSSRTQTSVGLTTTVFSTRAIMAWVRTFFMPSASVDTWAKTDGNDTEARRLMGVVAGTGDLKADGTIPLTADWDAGNYAFTGKSFTSKRTDAAQTLKLYEATRDGNDSITITVPAAGTGLAADGTITFNQSLAFTGTMTAANLCKYTAAGTVISCDVATSTFAPATSGSSLLKGNGSGGTAAAGLADLPKPVYQADNGTALVCGGYYESSSTGVFKLPVVAQGCQVCVTQGNNKTNTIYIQPPDANGVLEPSAKTALCSAGQYLKDSGTAAATDYICAVGTATANTWKTMGVSGTWTCVTAP